MELDETATPEEAASMLGITKKTLYNKVQAHELPYYRISRKNILFMRREIIDYVKRHRVPSADEVQHLEKEKLRENESDHPFRTSLINRQKAVR